MKLDVEELVKRAKAGDEEAYSILFNSVKDTLKAIAYKKLDNELDREDLIQETYFLAFKHIHELKEPKKFKYWICVILFNICNKFYKNFKFKEVTLDDNYVADSDVFDKIHSKLNYEKLISTLSPKDQKIFNLYDDDQYKVKEIASELDMKETTVKSRLSRGRQKIKIMHFLLALIVVLTITGGIIAICRSGILKDWFDTKSIGDNDDGVLMAIEHLDWYQEVDMNYIDLNDNYNIKLDYILMDQMCLYMVFDIKSEKDISKITQITFIDLVVTNEKNEIICDCRKTSLAQSKIRMGTKLIENKNSHAKVLFYMYTDSLPISQKLNISFSKTKFSHKNFFTYNYFYINTSKKFEIELIEKFINRNYVSYTSTNDNIQKAIVSETGFYATIKTEKPKAIECILIDENNNIYNCYATYIYDHTGLEYIITTPLNNTDLKTLNLIIDNQSYNLQKIS